MNQCQQSKTNSASSTSLYNCPTCQDNGVILVSEQCSGYPDGELIDFIYPCPDCNGGHVARVEAIKKSSGIPEIYTSAKYNSFSWNVYRDKSGNIIDMGKTRQLVENLFRNYREWKSNGMGLYIHSSTKGAGKTLLVQDNL